MFQSTIQKAAFVFATGLTLFALNSQAQFLGVEVGVRQQSATAEAAGVSTDTEMAYQFGMVGAFPMTEQLLFRSGFLYTQRPVTAKTGTATSKYSFNYFDIPVTLMWKFNDYGGVYGGVNVGLIAAASCDNCGVGNDPEKKGMMPLVIGGTFKFAPQFGVDIYYEAGKINKDFKEARAVGANLLITFD